MMQAINMFAALGLGFDDLSSRPPNIRGFSQEQLNYPKERVEAGEIDTAKLQKRLEIRFGEAAEGIVGEDGTVDFEKLESLIREQRVSQLQDLLEARFGEDAEGIVGADGTVDSEKLESLIREQRVSQFQNFLEARFGEDAEGIVGADGTVDFEALRAFLEEQGLDRPYGQSDTSGQSFDSAADQQPLIDFQA